MSAPPPRSTSKSLFIGHKTSQERKCTVQVLVLLVWIAARGNFVTAAPMSRFGNNVCPHKSSSKSLFNGSQNFTRTNFHSPREFSLSTKSHLRTLNRQWYPSPSCNIPKRPRSANHIQNPNLGDWNINSMRSSRDDHQQCTNGSNV
jgi:hypothetical protein